MKLVFSLVISLVLLSNTLTFLSPYDTYTDSVETKDKMKKAISRFSTMAARRRSNIQAVDKFYLEPRLSKQRPRLIPRSTISRWQRYISTFGIFCSG